MILAVQIALTLDVKIAWFSSQMAVCANQQNIYAIFVSSKLKKSLSLAVWWLMYPLLIKSFKIFSGIKIYNTLYKSWSPIEYS